jgi:NAD(P)-dependent dehydrogenase (short-subunit alcohol dehydrogenase family)
MLEKKQGRIVFFPAKFAIEPKPRFGAYAVSKVGLITLMKALREELKETDITINAVMPDAIDTWRTRNTPNAQPDKWVKTSDIANLLYCDCSSECDILNGAILKTFGKT